MPDTRFASIAERAQRMDGFQQTLEPISNTGRYKIMENSVDGDVYATVNGGAWVKIINPAGIVVPGGAVTLQSAYNGGPGVNLAAGAPISLVVSGVTSDALQLTQNDGTSNASRGLYVLRNADPAGASNWTGTLASLVNAPATTNASISGTPGILLISHAPSIDGGVLTDNTVGAFIQMKPITASPVTGVSIDLNNLSTGPALLVNHLGTTAGAAGDPQIALAINGSTRSAGFDLYDGSTLPLGPATAARIRYNGGALQVSLAGAAYVNFDVSTPDTLQSAYASGPGIVVTAGLGPVTIANAAAVSAPLLALSELDRATNANLPFSIIRNPDPNNLTARTGSLLSVSNIPSTTNASSESMSGIVYVLHQPAAGAGAVTDTTTGVLVEMMPKASVLSSVIGQTIRMGASVDSFSSALTTIWNSPAGTGGIPSNGIVSIYTNAVISSAALTFLAIGSRTANLTISGNVKGIDIDLLTNTLHGISAVSGISIMLGNSSHASTRGISVASTQTGPGSAGISVSMTGSGTVIGQLIEMSPLGLSATIGQQITMNALCTGNAIAITQAGSGSGISVNSTAAAGVLAPVLLVGGNPSTVLKPVGVASGKIGTVTVQNKARYGSAWVNIVRNKSAVAGSLWFLGWDETNFAGAVAASILDAQTHMVTLDGVTNVDAATNNVEFVNLRLLTPLTTNAATATINISTGASAGYGIYALSSSIVPTSFVHFAASSTGAIVATNSNTGSFFYASAAWNFDGVAQTFTRAGASGASLLRADNLWTGTNGTVNDSTWCLSVNNAPTAMGATMNLSGRLLSLVHQPINPITSDTTVGIYCSMNGNGTVLGASFFMAGNCSSYGVVIAHSAANAAVGTAALRVESSTTKAGGISFGNSVLQAVGVATEGVIRYNGTTEKFQASLGGAAFVDIATGTAGVTLDGAYDFGGAGVGRTITADAGAVEINSDANGGFTVNNTSPSDLASGKLAYFARTGTGGADSASTFYVLNNMIHGLSSQTHTVPFVTFRQLIVNTGTIYTTTINNAVVEIISDSTSNTGTLYDNTIGLKVTISRGVITGMDATGIYINNLNSALGRGMLIDWYSGPSIRMQSGYWGAGLEFADGRNMAVSAAGEGRLRYNGLTNKFQISETNGAYVDLVNTGSLTLDNAYNGGASITQTTAKGSVQITSTSTLGIVFSMNSVASHTGTWTGLLLDYGAFGDFVPADQIAKVLHINSAYHNRNAASGSLWIDSTQALGYGIYVGVTSWQPGGNWLAGIRVDMLAYGDNSDGIIVANGAAINSVYHFHSYHAGSGPNFISLRSEYVGTGLGFDTLTQTGCYVTLAQCAGGYTAVNLRGLWVISSPTSATFGCVTYNGYGTYVDHTPGAGVGNLQNDNFIAHYWTINPTLAGTVTRPVKGILGVMGTNCASTACAARFDWNSAAGTNGATDNAIVNITTNAAISSAVLTFLSISSRSANLTTSGQTKGVYVDLSTNVTGDAADRIAYDVLMGASAHAATTLFKGASTQTDGFGLDLNLSGVGVTTGSRITMGASCTNYAQQIVHNGSVAGATSFSVRFEGNSKSVGLSFGDGKDCSVVNAGSGGLMYDAVAKVFKVSLDGGAWTALSTVGGGTLETAYNFGGAGAGRTINAISNAVVITSSAADNNNILTLTKNPAGAQTGTVLEVNGTPGASAAMIGQTITMGANTSVTGQASKILWQSLAGSSAGVSSIALDVGGTGLASAKLLDLGATATGTYRIGAFTLTGLNVNLSSNINATSDNATVIGGYFTIPRTTAATTRGWVVSSVQEGGAGGEITMTPANATTTILGLAISLVGANAQGPCLQLANGGTNANHLTFTSAVDGTGSHLYGPTSAPLVFKAGQPGGTANGRAITFTASNGSTDGNGGDVTLTTGALANTGRRGYVTVNGSLAETDIASVAFNAGGTTTIPCGDGNSFSITATGSTTWAFSKPIDSGYAYSFTLVLRNGATGGAVQTWPVATRWPSGVPPVLTIAGYDVLVFFTTDNGTTWRGVLAQADSK